MTLETKVCNSDLSENWDYSRNKRMRGGQSLSAITAALRDEEEDSDDGGPMDEDTAIEDVDNPRWQLYETIKNMTNNQGIVNFPLSMIPV